MKMAVFNSAYRSDCRMIVKRIDRKRFDWYFMTIFVGIKIGIHVYEL